LFFFAGVEHREKRGEAEAMVAVRGMILKAVQRHLGFTSMLMVCGFAIGLLFQYLFDDPQQRHVGYYVHSGVHGVVLALVLCRFGALLQERFRRAPLLLELAARVGLMVMPLTAAAILLQVACTVRLRPNSWRIVCP
jgi:hypothetical protein